MTFGPVLFLESWANTTTACFNCARGKRRTLCIQGKKSTNEPHPQGVAVFSCFFFFRSGVSLRNPGFPGTHNPPAYNSRQALCTQELTRGTPQWTRKNGISRARKHPVFHYYRKYGQIIYKDGGLPDCSFWRLQSLSMVLATAEASCSIECGKGPW